MQRKILIKYSSIQYNCLNLPSKVIFKDGGTIAYIYGADGTKLRTVHQIGGTTTITEYCGNVIYENDTAKRLLTEVGYITLSDKKSHYYLQDHQGNNRVVLNESGSVEEVNHYYPFGGLYANSTNVQPYKYNGKELDTKKGLNWYDYGARMYDAAVGRWHAVDPLAEKYYEVSPYVYCLNDPVKLVDPDGKIPFIAGLLGGAIDYMFQVASNRFEGKSWSESLTDIDVKSVVISAGASMTGVGLANVTNKGIKAIKIAQTSAKTATALKIAGEVAVDATVSATSQYLKDGEISGKNVAVDVVTGYGSGKVGNFVKSSRQNSSEGKLLTRQVDHARRVAGDNPRASRAEKLRVATEKAERYGSDAANAVSTTVSNIGSEFVNKIFRDDKGR